MPGLDWLKHLKPANPCDSRSLMADSKQTLACAWLSLALLIGLVLYHFYGIWQADPIIGLVVVAFFA